MEWGVAVGRRQVGQSRTRRRVLEAVAVPLFVVALAGCWLSPRANNQSTGFQPDHGGITRHTIGQLHRVWTATTVGSGSPGSVVTDGQTAFVHAGSTLEAYDAAGFDNCIPGTPRECEPIWQGTTGTTTANPQAATIGGDLVYVVVGFTQDPSGRLLAFAKEGCGAETCDPVWHADLPDSSGPSAPLVDGSLVYVSAVGGVRAYDAAGIEGCDTSLRECNPIWTTANEGIPAAVWDERLYVGTDNGIDVYSALGSLECNGLPPVCTPWFNMGTGEPDRFTAVAISRGRAFAIENEEGTLDVWDATGAVPCSGPTPAVCPPLTKTTVDVKGVPAFGRLGVYAMGTDPENKVNAFDASGTTVCPDDLCPPVWQGAAGPITSRGGPSVVGDVVLLASTDGSLYSFEAFGLGCGLTPPYQCNPLSNVVAGPLDAPPSISTGVVYTAGSHGVITAWRVD